MPGINPRTGLWDPNYDPLFDDYIGAQLQKAQQTAVAPRPTLAQVQNMVPAANRPIGTAIAEKPKEAIAQPKASINPVIPATPVIPTVTMPAVTATATTGNAIAKNPYLDPTAREKFIAGQQPGIRQATDAVTSAVNPFMKGNLGASLLRDVNAPAQTALANFDLGQSEKAQGWEADQITAATQQKQQNIENLRTLAESPNATEEDIARYRAAIAGTTYTPPTTPPVVPGKEVPAIQLTAKEKSDLATTISQLQGMDTTNPAIKSQLNTAFNKLYGTTGVDYVSPSANKKATSDFEYLATRIPQFDSKDQTPMAIAWRRYDEIAGSVEDGSASPTDLTEFNTLTAAFKKYLTGGNNMSDPAFLKYAPNGGTRFFKDLAGRTVYY